MLYILLLLLSTQSWTSTDQLGKLISGLDDLNIDPKCQAMTDSDLALYCAEELCGKSKNEISVINISNFQKILTPEEVKKVNSIPLEMRTHLTGLQKQAKLLDQKALAIKNGKASAQDAQSNYAADLVKLYPIAPKVEAMVQEKLKTLVEDAALCKASMVLDLVNSKRPKNDLLKVAAQQMDQAVLTKLSSQTAQKIRSHLKNNVQVSYPGIQRGQFDVGYYPKKPIELKSVSDFVDFGKKINQHLNNYSCNSILKDGPQMLITDSVGHDDQSKNKRSDLNISPYSCTHGVSTENIVAHEVGHIVTYYMSNYGPSSGSKKKFLHHRECVKTQGFGQQDKRKVKRFAGDHVTTEEDHADALAFEIKNKNSNLCAMLASNGKEFMNLDYKLAANPSHSPALLRIMRDFLSKGMKLPDTCRELAKRNFSKNAFNQCPL